MLCNIIACGQTGGLWNGEGYSIGVNDCLKFGKPVKRLIVVNNFAKFPDREKVILSTIPEDGFYSQISRYCTHPKYKHIGSMQRFKGLYKSGVLYYSNISPFIAISMAVNLGNKDIVLYGVDLVDHPNIRGNSLKIEFEQIKQFSKCLQDSGINIYLSTKFGALADILPVWSGFTQQHLKLTV